MLWVLGRVEWFQHTVDSVQEDAAYARALASISLGQGQEIIYVYIDICQLFA